MHPRNSLERLVEADGGGAVEDDVDVLGQDTLIFFAQIQLRLCEVTVHGDDLLRKARLLLLQSFKELRSRGRQSCSSMGAKCGQTLRFFITPTCGPGAPPRCCLIVSQLHVQTSLQKMQHPAMAAACSILHLTRSRCCTTATQLLHV